MYRTLLVPLDGSAYGERALPLAASLARRFKAQIILLRSAFAPTFPPADPADPREGAAGEAQAYLDNVAAWLHGDGLEIQTMVPCGDAAEEILLAVRLRSADLVVMCSHGRSGLGRWIYGSVAEQVLHKSPVPVLLVRPTGEIASLPADIATMSILVPLDGSPFSEAALPHASELARALGGGLQLLRVVEPVSAGYAFAEVSLAPPSRDETFGEAALWVEDVAKRLRDEGLHVTTEVREGYPADVISRWCEGSAPALIVMATHGRSGVARLLLGNVAIEVVRRSPLPVMLIRPGKKLAAAS